MWFVWFAVEHTRNKYKLLSWQTPVATAHHLNQPLYPILTDVLCTLFVHSQIWQRAECVVVRKSCVSIKTTNNINVNVLLAICNWISCDNQSESNMIEITCNDRLGKKVRVKCNPDDTIGDLKKLIAAQTGTKYDKIVLKKWYTIYKDSIRLSDCKLFNSYSRLYCIWGAYKYIYEY